MKKKLLILSALVGTMSAAHAGLILSDDFPYTDGSIVAASNSVWVQNTGTAGSALVSNQMLITSSARTEDIARFLTGFPYTTNSGSVLYASLKFNCQALPANTTANNVYFAHFGGSNEFSTAAASGMSGHRARISVSTTNNIAGTTLSNGTFCVYVQNSNEGTSVTNQWPTAFATNTDYTLVVKYVVSNALSTIWINPSAETDPHVSNTNPVPYDFGVNGRETNGPLDIVAYNFRQAGSQGTMLIDNLRVGTIFADVAGSNTAPAISSIDDQFIPRNTNTGPLAFTVQDNETASGLTVTASSGNTALVPNNPANLTLTGSPGTNRTLTVTPATGQQGSATITVNVSDSVNTSSITFKVVVGAPTISPIADQTSITNTPVPSVTVTVTDAENDAITFRTSSSNTNLITTNNISITGSGPNYTMTLSPNAGLAGVSFITVFASDGFTTNSTSFRLIRRPLLGLVFDEDFAYTNFSASIPNGLEGAVGGSGFAWSGESWKHVSPAAEHFEMQVTNGLVYLSHATNANEDVGNALTNAPYFGSNGVTFYMSFPATWSFLPSPSGEYFIHLKESDTDSSNFRCKVFARTNGAALGSFRLGIANIANSPVMLGQDLNLGQTYQVVTRYNSANGESTIWINPHGEGSLHATANDTPGASTIGGIALRQPGGGIGDLTVGHLKIGTAFSDVATVFSTPSPETLNINLLANGQTVLSWTSPSFQLASSPDVTGPYVPIPGATSPYTNSPSATQTYYRLVFP